MQHINILTVAEFNSQDQTRNDDTLKGLFGVLNLVNIETIK